MLTLTVDVKGRSIPSKLTELIHKFHDGPARELYSRFADRRNSLIAIVTAGAVANGLIEEKDVTPEVMVHIAKLLQVWREMGS